MSKTEKFGLFTGIIGLIVDSTALIGFAIGAIEISPEFGFWANPFVIAVTTFSFLCFSLCICLFFVVQFAKNRWRKNRVSPKSDREGEYPGLKTISWFLWLPTSILWGIGMSRYFWMYYMGTASIADPETQVIVPLIAVPFGFYFLFIPMFGSYMLPDIAISLNEFFDPSEYFS